MPTIANANAECKREITDLIYGPNTFTIGSGGNYSTITDAMTDQTGTGIEIRASVSKGITAIGTILIGTGTLWLKPGQDPRTSEEAAVGDLISVDGGPWEKIKSVASDTQIILFGTGTTGSSFRLARIVPKTFLLFSGEYAESLIPFEPGFNLVGIDRSACRLSEASSDSVIDQYGENLIANLTLAPTLAWGALDSVASLTPYTDIWDGAELRFRNVSIRTGNADGTHAGSAGSWPFMSNGLTVYDNCEIAVHGAFRGANVLHSGSTVNTKILFKQCQMQNTVGIETAIVEPSLMIVPPNSTVDMVGCALSWRDFGQTASSGSLAAIKLGTSLGSGWGSTNSILNINSSTVDCQGLGTGFIVDGLETTATCNISHSTVSHGVTAGAVTAVNARGTDFNIFNSNIVGVAITSGNRYGINCSSASSTVNLRGACRVEGTTNSLIRSAGTINKGANCVSIGAESGTITALDT